MVNGTTKRGIPVLFVKMLNMLQSYNQHNINLLYMLKQESMVQRRWSYQEMFEELKLYLTHFRPTSQQEELLLNWGGGKMSPRTIINGLSKELALVDVQKRYVFYL